MVSYSFSLYRTPQDRHRLHGFLLHLLVGYSSIGFCFDSLWVNQNKSQVYNNRQEDGEEIQEVDAYLVEYYKVN